MTLDPGPDVRAVWSADTDKRRALAHFHEHAEFDTDAWGRAVFARMQPMRCHKTWLDWGCGGGAIARVVIEHAQPTRYHAIDVSFDALATTAAIDPKHVVPLLPTETGAIKSASVDYIVSTSCFQHFPSRDYAREVLREMRRVAAPSARGLIQIRYYEPGDAYDPAKTSRSAYEHVYIRACAWRPDEFAAELALAGFAAECVLLEPHRQYAWYSFEVAT